MKTFENGNWNGNQKCCPICKQTEGEVILVPIVGTQDGKNSEAIQVHPKCILEKAYYYPPSKEVDEIGVFVSHCLKD